MMDASLTLDYQLTDTCHDYMIDWVDGEAKRVGRFLSWDEARDFLRTRINDSGHGVFRTDGMEVLSEWIGGTHVNVTSYKVEGAPGVAWGNYEEEEEAHIVVKSFYKRTSRPVPNYTIILDNGNQEGTT